MSKPIASLKHQYNLRSNESYLKYFIERSSEKLDAAVIFWRKIEVERFQKTAYHEESIQNYASKQLD